jgi:hypothetical protein
VRSQPIIFSAEMVHALLAGRKTQTRRKVKSKNILMPEPSECYYGQSGSGLWVREVFANNETGIIYKADNPTASVGWISPIYMPRKASRISLKITEVSIERVQDISEQDAISEGLIYNDLGSVGWRGHKQMMEQTLPVTAYAPSLGREV